MSAAQDTWTLEQLLAACGDVANARTVRFWIKEGLVPPPSGGRGAHARYGARHAARIAEIRRYQALGLSLANVALLLDAEPPAAPVDAAEVPFWAQRPAGVASATGVARPARAASAERVSPAPPSRQVVTLAPGIALQLDAPADAAPLDEAALAALARASAPLLATYAALRAGPPPSSVPSAPPAPPSSPTLPPSTPNAPSSSPAPCPPVQEG